MPPNSFAPTALTGPQIKYSELPSFSEVMAAGTAAALVPIRSITRRIASSDPKSLTATVKSHSRLSSTGSEETVTYIPDSQDDAGPVCLKLLSQLKAIQLGKAKDEFGWCFSVSEEDRKKVSGAQVQNGNGMGGETVDQLD